MLPRLLEIPVWPSVILTWPLFIGIVLVLMAVLTAGSKVAEKSKLAGLLLTWIPIAIFATSLVTFVQTPILDGKLPLNTYGFSIMTGFLLASWIAVKRGKLQGFKGDFVLDVGIIGMIFGIIGSKINYLAQYYEAPREVLEGGMLEIWGDMGMNPLGAILLGPIPFAFWYWRIRVSSEKVTPFSLNSIVLILLTLVFAILGSRALFLYQHHEEYSWAIFRNWQSGFVLYGGLLTGAPASIIYILLRRKSVALMTDIAAAPMMLAVAFGRIGCFLNGCCWGKPGDAFTCVTFPEGSAVATYNQIHHLENVPVHPTQLYETTACLAFFGILIWLSVRPRKAKGELMFMMFMLYGSWRFGLEYLRGDERPNWIGDLSFSQVISLFAVFACGIVLYVIRQIAKRHRDLGTDEPGVDEPPSEPKETPA